jgi:uncharacterized protein (DUF2141 family)
MEARSVLVGAMILACVAVESARAEGVAPAPITVSDKDCAGRKTGTRLVVQVGALRSDAGQVVVTVFPSNPDRFLAPHGKIARRRIRTSAPMTQVCFNLPGPDIYAVAVYHDANNNKDLDRGPQGAPTEGYGFSNDAVTKFAAPSFDAARFAVKAGDNVIRIKMRYPR